MLEETGCDYIVSIFPTKDGAEELINAKINTMNLVGHFNSIAERTAERLGISREKNSHKHGRGRIHDEAKLRSGLKHAPLQGTQG